MPSVSKTKSGKTFRAPTDQARKLERRKENRKNKRDRKQIRQTIAKCCNVDDTVRKMLSIDRQLLGLDEPQFHVDVLRKKQSTLMGMLERRKQVLREPKDDAEYGQLMEKLQHYYQDSKELKALADQEKLAKNADLETIPLPDGDMAYGERRITQLMGPHATHIPMPKKKVDFRVPRSSKSGRLEPPGPPCGVAPSLSDSEGEDYDDEDNDDDLAPIPIPDDFDAPRPPVFNSYAPPLMPIRKIPGPPPLSALYNNPMGMPMPIHVPEVPGPTGAIISSAPMIRKEPSSGGDSSATIAAGPSVVTAAPQLRDLRRETVKLVPSVLKKTKIVPRSKPVAVYARPPPAESQTAKNTDDAYNDFMKEISDLL